ncbi:hypothetical protein ATZ35_11255 [Enterococcus rotai]|uniref:Pre-toxin TG domain-containing protein n=1 Tax=Enterococcus rotai TaxID=118060 RepID=A0A0U2VJL2_9ENTE|nr:hypothetical protein [Enterococcus rotai]ALS37707.1 hypothetical protein ATZ35_11255 [Enterococcus rotai]
MNDFQKSGRDYFSGDKVGMPGFGGFAHGQDLAGRVQESGLWDAMWAVGLTGAVVRNAQVYGKKAGGVDIPNTDVGVVQSRLNLAENPTRFSPSNNAGMKHVRDRHFDSDTEKCWTIFSIGIKIEIYTAIKKSCRYSCS